MLEVLLCEKRYFYFFAKIEVPLSVKRTEIGHAMHRVSGAAWVAEKCALPKGNKEVSLSLKHAAIGQA
jgi:uncharacterized lipoprotein YbaY